MTRPVRRQHLTLGPGLYCIVLVLLAIMTERAQAHPFDSYGFTSRAIAMGGGFVAAATDVDAAYYNVAALTRTPGFLVSAGLLVVDDWLTANGHGARLDTHVLTSLGFATPLPIAAVLRDRLYLAVVAAFPKEGFYSIDLPDDEDLHFLFDDARNRRIVLHAGLAGRIFDWLSVGIGFSLLPNVFGHVKADLAKSTGYNSADIDVRYNAAVTAGLLLRPLAWLSFGIAFRQGHTAELTLPVDVKVYEGFSIAARVTAPAYAVPHELAFGMEIRPLQDLILAFDVTYSRFRSFRTPAPAVAVLEDGEVRQRGVVATAGFKDTWVPCFGLEWRPLTGLAIRGGYSFRDSPVPRQSGATNLLDADRNILSWGVGYAFRGWSGGPRGMSFDVHGQVSMFGRRVAEKEVFDVDNPGFPALTLSGGAVSAGFTWKLWY